MRPVLKTSGKGEALGENLRGQEDQQLSLIVSDSFVFEQPTQ